MVLFWPVRPPGHHAVSDRAMGDLPDNNVAVLGFSEVLRIAVMSSGSSIPSSTQAPAGRAKLGSGGEGFHTESTFSR
uniref:Uncharacterized protein n=1 Tax=uncultured organism TaxID=155900 RepID=Q1ZZI8_9ZZZZ|nr:unknown [uncultured organism]